MLICVPSTARRHKPLTSLDGNCLLNSEKTAGMASLETLDRCWNIAEQEGSPEAFLGNRKENFCSSYHRLFNSCFINPPQNYENNSTSPTDYQSFL